MSFAKEFGVGGFRESVLHVQHLDYWTKVFAEICEYDVLYQGMADDALAGYWQALEATGIGEILLAAPGATEGFVRLVNINGIENRVIRWCGRQWESGGIYDLDIRVRDIADTFSKLEAAFWQGIGKPFEYDMGPVRVSQAELFGPDRIVFALIQRINPPLWPDAGFDKVSNAFNSTQVCYDHEFEGLSDFYTDSLGFDCFIDTRISWKEPGENIFGLPFNVGAKTPAAVKIFHPTSQMAGATEICALDGLTGEHFGEHASPRNRGITALRYPVADLDGYFARVKAAGAKIMQEPTALTIAPYGDTRVFAVQAPTGAWLEFFEAN